MSDRSKNVDMKFSVTTYILETLKEVPMASIEIFFPKKYSYARISRQFFGLDSRPSLKISQKTFATLIWRLKRQGLIERRTFKGKSLWSLTSKGMNRLEKSFKRIPQKDGIKRLVIFDIPEKERKKRRLLRAELLAYNYHQLQKSVWLGENPLSKEFIITLDALRLRHNVHIFSVSQTGTLID